MIFSRHRQAKPTMPSRPQTITWRTPDGEYYNISNEALKAEHTLIAGTTGCGKTTFLRSIFQAALVQYSPADAKFILIDPKMFELTEYKDLPHTIRYTDSKQGAAEALELASAMLDERAMELKRSRGKHYDGAAVYVVIDELNDLLISEYGARIKRAMEHLITLGRALNIHLIACTQNPNAKTIPANIVDCYTCRYGLKCMRDVQSRQIVGIGGCELLPKHGQTIAAINGEIARYKLPYVTESEITPLLEYWMSSRCRA